MDRFKGLPLLLLAFMLTLPSAGQAAQHPGLKCDIGPIKRQYGGSAWLVYGCADGKSLAFVTAPDSPAAPFVFFYSYSQNRYHLYGEGTGNKPLTDEAFSDLKVLSSGQIHALILEADSVSRK